MGEMFKTAWPAKIAFGILLGIGLLLGCKKESVTVPASPDWYPLEVGSYYIYNVDSVKYFNSTVQPPLTIHYQIKDSVVSQFKDLAGNTAYKIEEYRRNTSADAWLAIRVFTRSRRSSEAEEVDGNNRTVKLVFPVSVNTSWNANKYNTLDTSHSFNSQYLAVNQAWGSAGNKYDSTLVVQLQNDSTLINNYYWQERYAANIGLVDFRRDFVDYTIIAKPNGGADTSIAGFRYRQTLIEFGH